MSYHDIPERMGSDKNKLFAVVLLAVSAGACLGATYSATSASTLYTAPATSVRVNPVASRVSAFPHDVNTRMQTAAMAGVQPYDVSMQQFSAAQNQVWRSPYCVRSTTFLHHRKFTTARLL